MVDFVADDTPELEAWRAEVRDFLETELPGGMHFDYDFEEDDARWAAGLAFWRKVGERGWVALCWPKEDYGLERPAIDYWIMMEEFSRHAVPSYPIIGMQVARALLRHGTAEQRREHLKGIAHVTTLWGEGYTEPQAGSDLASLTTRAARDGDHYVLNGQKTLGTAAHRATWMFVFARTDPATSRHQGISAFLVPLDSPGVSMTPLHNMADGQQNHTFFDNVRVPAEFRVGTEGEAWTQVWFGQGGERRDQGGAYQEPHLFRIERTLNLIRRFVRKTTRGGVPLAEDPVVRLKLAELELGVEIFRLQAFEAYSAFSTRRMRTGSPIYMANLHSAYFKEFVPHLAQTCMEILGPAAQLQGSKWAPMAGMIEKYFRSSFGNHAGGTPQLKRMTLAVRGLGLPR